MNFLRTGADGVDARLLQNQLFASTTDFEQFGAATAGPYLLAAVGGLTPREDEIHLANNYTALFAQDDWRVGDTLTVNLGLRWDYDSEFEARENFAPRVGMSWSVNPKTVVRAHFGIYYDQFRLGLARNVPAYGGTDQRQVQYMVFPRGFYGSPSFVSSIALISGLPGGCFSNNLVGNLTDAQIAASGMRCPVVASAPPLIGVDRLNNVVAPGRAPIPANTVISADNVQSLTGLTPQQYADQASAAIGQAQGYFVFGPTGYLTNVIIPAQLRPTAVAESFDTPHTLGYSVGVQRELSTDMSIEADYFHRDIRNLLGVRTSNIAFESRVLGRRFLPPFTAGPIITFGPFYEGQYDALIINFNKRYSSRFLLGASYTYAQATDNSLGIQSNPSDAFVGTVPVVTEPATGRSNANGEFTRANGTLVQAAGTFLNGPDRDKGPSDLAIDHMLQANGMVELPWQIQLSGIFRAQSGFHFSGQPNAGVLVDPDGDASVNGIDVNAGRNAFTTPPFVNLDMRFAKRFNVTSGIKAQVLLEFFNVFNRQNPAAVGAARMCRSSRLACRRKSCPDGKGKSVFVSSGKPWFGAAVTSERRSIIASYGRLAHPAVSYLICVAACQGEGMRLTSPAIHCGIGVCLAALIATAAWAQAPVGTISGMVRDQSDAVVPGVTITIRNAATGGAAHESVPTAPLRRRRSPPAPTPSWPSSQASGRSNPRSPSRPAGSAPSTCAWRSGPRPRSSPSPPTPSTSKPKRMR